VGRNHDSAIAAQFTPAIVASGGFAFIPFHPAPAPLPEPDPWLLAGGALAVGLLVSLLAPRLGKMMAARRRKPTSASTSRLVEVGDVVTATGGTAPAPVTTAGNGSDELPAHFAAEGARILIVGPTRSGKSTVLHQLVWRALSDGSFTRRIILDGKGSELAPYAQVDGVIYYDANQLDEWVPALQAIADDMPGRYQIMVDEGKRKADPGSPRDLIIIDEVQRATRNKERGKEITEALRLIAEQSGALADVMILTTQRAKHHTLSKDITYNANAIITMESAARPGLFNIRSSTSGAAEVSGQARYVDDNEIAAAVVELSQAQAQAKA
jgi:hypothetical protein